ncbi:butyrophilin-like protein 1 [Pempheris klunzingeri]|uniref:butyrophilin-like protein 1 n=1 Tax=Pempheris klunzingeri TaxID=3127111 RepID=UPI00398126EA
MLDPLSRIMQLLPVACLCLLSCSAVADGNGSEVTRVVKEDGDALLPCSLSTEQNIQSELFDWKKDGRNVFLYDAADEYNSGRSGQDVQFKGRVFHFQDQLKHGNASIIIRNTRVEDSGDYTCAFPRLQGHVFHIKLVVGAAPEPSVTILDETKDWALLYCKVQGAFPKPTVEWKDSAGNILPAEDTQVSERGGRFYITVNTTVTKTGHYHCVATQETIHHQTDAKIYVHFSDSTGWIVAAVVGPFLSLGLGVGVLLAVLYTKGCITVNPNKGSQAERDPL